MPDNTAEKAPEKATSTEVEKRLHFDPNDLRSLSSLEDAVRLLTDSGIGISDAATEIGDGFVMLENKDELIGKPFLMLLWAFVPGDFGEEYLISRIMTGDGRKLVITDGGTGISTQVRQFEERTNRKGGLMVERGIRKSEYVNEHGPGITYYLNV